MGERCRQHLGDLILWNVIKKMKHGGKKIWDENSVLFIVI